MLKLIAIALLLTTYYMALFFALETGHYLQILIFGLAGALVGQQLMRHCDENR